jgi:peptide/nickel transport system substrate-binding protein
MTLTYRLRKGVQFSEGWGELTSEDVRFTFEQHAQKDSIGLTAAARSIASMDTTDPHTLIVNFKTAQPTFFATFSMGNNGSCQGIVCKKYVEAVGNTAASQKPIGSGPLKIIDSRLGSFYKFEALDSHWRVVPEFKILILRMVPEISTTVAMLKTKEIDLASVPAEQLADLGNAGIATEVSPIGGSIIVASWGGMVIPEDNRYDATFHNMDPWVDPKVRKAMTISIDRQAICKAIFAGGAFPAGAVLFTGDMDKYQHPFNPSVARQLLAEAGYPNGFSFKLMSYAQPGVPETPRIMEALAGYWQQIGLDPQIN